jgi:hypothetical protein
MADTDSPAGDARASGLAGASPPLAAWGRTCSSPSEVGDGSFVVKSDPLANDGSGADAAVSRGQVVGECVSKIDAHQSRLLAQWWSPIKGNLPPLSLCLPPGTAPALLQESLRCTKITQEGGGGGKQESALNAASGHNNLPGHRKCECTCRQKCTDWC